MKQYQKTQDGFLIGNKGIPNDNKNADFLQMMKEVDSGDAEIVDYKEPELTEQQMSSKMKLEGIEFDGVMCSATSEDMWGLASIKDWIKAGQSTNFQFKNGNKLTLTESNIDAFEAVWIPFRASFFQQ